MREISFATVILIGVKFNFICKITTGFNFIKLVVQVSQR